MNQNRSITFFDMFSGIGKFRARLEWAGGFACTGHCEIDKHADQLLKVDSDPHAYRQAGNAVTVNVIHALALRLKAFYMEATVGEGEAERRQT